MFDAGVLTADGDDDMITMTTLQADSWHGIVFNAANQSGYHAVQPCMLFEITLLHYGEAASPQWKIFVAWST